MWTQRVLVAGIVVAVIVVAGALLFSQLFDVGLRKADPGDNLVLNVGYHPAQEEDHLGLPLAYEEGWDQPGVSQLLWKSWGYPYPFQVDGLGRDGSGALNPNGDKNYQSGMTSRFAVDLSQGAVIEFWAKGTTTETSEHWQNLNVGMGAGSAEDYYSDEQVPVDILNTFIVPESYTQHVEYRIGSEFKQEPFEPLNDGWHRYSIAIRDDGSVEFYRDGELKFAPETKVDRDLFASASVVIDGRSWRTDMLLDDLAIYGTLIVPDTLTVESGTELLADGIVLAAASDLEQGIMQRMKAGDLDGDGDVDAVVTSWGSAKALYAVENPGSLTAKWPLHRMGKQRSLIYKMKLADFDGDGDLDVVTGTSAEVDVELLLYENTGDPFGGPWPVTEFGATDDGIYAMREADFDGDGDLDVATGGRRDDDFDINVWENDGTPFDGRWTDIKVGPSDGDVTSMQIAELDGDGLPDIVTGASGQEPYEIHAWRNDGEPWDNYWQGQDIGVTDVNTTDLAVVDLDGNGTLDVVSSSVLRRDAPELILWRATGAPFDGGWTGTPLAMLDENVTALEAVDVDGDGDADLLTVTPSMLVVWENVAGE